MVIASEAIVMMIAFSSYALLLLTMGAPLERSDDSKPLAVSCVQELQATGKQNSSQAILSQVPPHLDPPTLAEVLTAAPGEGEDFDPEDYQQYFEMKDFIESAPDWLGDFHFEKNSSGYDLFVLDSVAKSNLREGRVVIISAGKRVETFAERTTLSSGDRIKIPELHYEIILPAGDTSSSRSITPYLQYRISQILSDSVKEAFAYRNRGFLSDHERYFSFAEELGWKPDGKFHWFSFRKLYELYQKAREQSPDRKLLFPAILLWKHKTSFNHSQQLNQTQHDDDLYFSLPWNAIPATYQLIPHPFIPDPMERKLNANEFFTFGAAKGFLAHDFLGHIRSLIEQPGFSKELVMASRALVGPDWAEIERLPDGILKMKYFEHHGDWSSYGRVSYSAENSFRLEVDDFEDLNLINSSRNAQNWEALVTEIQEREKKHPGFIADRFRYLYRILKMHLKPVGGYSNDIYLISRNATKSHTQELLEKEIDQAAANGGSSRWYLDGMKYRDFFSILYRYLIPIYEIIESNNVLITTPFQAEKTEYFSHILAALELNIFFIRNSNPESILRSVYDSSDSARLERLSEWAKPGNFTYPPHGSEWIWLPSDESALSLAARRKYFLSYINPLIQSPKDAIDGYRTMITVLEIVKQMNLETELKDLFDQWLDLFFQNNSVWELSNIPAPWYQDFHERLQKWRNRDRKNIGQDTKKVP